MKGRWEFIEHKPIQQTYDNNNNNNNNKLYFYNYNYNYN